MEDPTLHFVDCALVGLALVGFALVGLVLGHIWGVVWTRLYFFTRGYSREIL